MDNNTEYLPIDFRLPMSFGRVSITRFAKKPWVRDGKVEHEFPARISSIGEMSWRDIHLENYAAVDRHSQDILGIIWDVLSHMTRYAKMRVGIDLHKTKDNFVLDWCLMVHPDETADDISLERYNWMVGFFSEKARVFQIRIDLYNFAPGEIRKFELEINDHELSHLDTLNDDYPIIPVKISNPHEVNTYVSNH